MMETRTIEAIIVQKLKNNETRPKFTGSYKKKRVLWCSTLLFFCFYNNLFLEEHEA